MSDQGGGGTYLDNCPACPFAPAWCHGVWQPELCPEISGIPDGGRPTAAESIRLLGLMKLCPWREERTDCGCAGLARCAVGLGVHGLVNHQDCLACLHQST